ncbi:hypothetical protein ACFL54_01075 [Planctomycetota bacterium]
MQVFNRGSIHSHCVGELWPKFLGNVDIGETFVVETEQFNAANGPIAISGIKAGDAIAVHIEEIEICGPFAAYNGGPFIDGSKEPLEYRDGYFFWPKYFRLKANPSVGNISVLPELTDEIIEMSKEYNYKGRRWKNDSGWRRIVNDPRDKHCHQDCPWANAGSIVHLKAQVDNAGLCLADIHGYIGQGEMGFAAIEVAANVKVRVERSSDWLVDWPIVETENEIMVFSSYSSAYIHRPSLRYVDVIRQAYRSLCEVVAARIGGTFDVANTIVASAVDIRNCALYGLEGFISQEKSPHTSEIAVVACLPKDIFVD